MALISILSLTFAETSSSDVRLRPMNREHLKARAFYRCQTKFVAPKIEPVPILDPTWPGGPADIGLVFQEELAIRTSNILDQNGFYVSPRPRAAVNNLGMKIYVESSTPELYEPRTWDDANPDYSHPSIQPPIVRDEIPDAGRVLTEIIVGHVSPTGDYPQLFDIRSSAYVRFAGYPPQITGASLRLAAHHIFGIATGAPVAREDFPILREVYLSVKDADTMKAFVFIENKTFCGALELEMSATEVASITVDGYWYSREDVPWQKNRHSGFVAYSSMLFQNEDHTPERDSDEAHDSDTLRVKYADGSEIRHKIGLPDRRLTVHDFSKNAQDSNPIEWTLANEDRDPAHYADFEPALRETNYDKRVGYRVEILESNIKTGVQLYEHSPDGEYGDNIVAVSNIREDIQKATDINQFVRFKYRTSVSWP